MIFDREFKFDKQSEAIVKVSFFQLRLLTKVNFFLSYSDLKKAMHAFISSRNDYCYELNTSLTQSSLHHLQLE